MSLPSNPSDSADKLYIATLFRDHDAVLSHKGKPVYYVFSQRSAKAKFRRASDLQHSNMVIVEVMENTPELFSHEMVHAFKKYLISVGIMKAGIEMEVHNGKNLESCMGEIKRFKKQAKHLAKDLLTSSDTQRYVGLCGSSSSDTLNLKVQELQRLSAWAMSAHPTNGASITAAACVCSGDDGEGNLPTSYTTAPDSPPAYGSEEPTPTEGSFNAK